MNERDGGVSETMRLHSDDCRNQEATRQVEALELVAQPGRCEEASTLSREKYIPCNAPAKYLINNGDIRSYRMCKPCADHNVRNRGARLLRELTPEEQEGTQA